MEISLLKVLLNNITCFSHLSSSDHISGELVRKYYCKIEDILKLVKPILDAIVDVEAASGELLLKAFAGLAQCVDELRELFETLEPLCSKVYFVRLEIYPLVITFMSSISRLSYYSLHLIVLKTFKIKENSIVVSFCAYKIFMTNM